MFILESPPHARGWTFCGWSGYIEPDVSPARAGMDPGEMEVAA